MWIYRRLRSHTRAHAEYRLKQTAWAPWRFPSLNLDLPVIARGGLFVSSHSTRSGTAPALTDEILGWPPLVVGGDVDVLNGYLANSLSIGAERKFGCANPIGESWTSTAL